MISHDDGRLVQVRVAVGLCGIYVFLFAMTPCHPPMPTLISPPKPVVTHRGETTAHAHQCTWHPTMPHTLLVTDLGLDYVAAYAADRVTGMLESMGVSPMPPGTVRLMWFYSPQLLSFEKPPPHAHAHARIHA